MSVVFSKDGLRRLRAGWILLAVSVGATAAIVAASHLYLEKDKRDVGQGATKLREEKNKLEAVRRERDSLEASSEVFRGLVERGILKEERRIEMVELAAELRNRFGLLSLEYEIAPQRPLPGASFAAVDILASRVRVRMRAVHEGDALGFLEALEGARGIYPVDRCVLRRLEEAGAPGRSARVEADCQLEWITLRRKGA